MKISSILSFLLLSVLSAPASAKTIKLMSQEGVAIEINYDVVEEIQHSNKPGVIYTAEPVTIAVSRRNLRPSSRIRAVLINKVVSYPMCGILGGYTEYVYEVDLRTSSPGVLAANLRDGKVSYKSTPTGRMTSQPARNMDFVIEARPYCAFRQSVAAEIAIVVNDRWLKDPINGTSNFQIRLNKDVTEEGPVRQ